MKVISQSSDPLLLVGPMQVSELLEPNNVDSGKTTSQLLLENRKQLVASEKVVPQEGHASTPESVEAWRISPCLDTHG